MARRVSLSSVVSDARHSIRRALLLANCLSRGCSLRLAGVWLGVTVERSSDRSGLVAGFVSKSIIKIGNQLCLGVSLGFTQNAHQSLAHLCARSALPLVFSKCPRFTRQLTSNFVFVTPFFSLCMRSYDPSQF